MRKHEACFDPVALGIVSINANKESHKMCLASCFKFQGISSKITTQSVLVLQNISIKKRWLCFISLSVSRIFIHPALFWDTRYVEISESTLYRNRYPLTSFVNRIWKCTTNIQTAIQNPPISFFLLCGVYSIPDLCNSTSIIFIRHIKQLWSHPIGTMCWDFFLKIWNLKSQHLKN